MSPKCTTLDDPKQLFRVKFWFTCQHETFDTLFTDRDAQVWEASQKIVDNVKIVGHVNNESVTSCLTLQTVIYVENLLRLISDTMKKLPTYYGLAMGKMV